MYVAYFMLMAHASNLCGSFYAYMPLQMIYMPICLFKSFWTIECKIGLLTFGTTTNLQKSFFSISVAPIFHHFLWWSFTTEPPMISSFVPPHRQYCDYLAYIYQTVSAPSVIWLLVKICTGTLASPQGPMNRLLLCKCTRSSASNTSPYFIVPRLSRVATFSSKNLNS